MGYKCCILGCKTNYDPTVAEKGKKESRYKTVFTIPKHNYVYPEVRKIWIKRISHHSKDLIVKRAWICCLHFNKEDFKLINIKTGQPRRRAALHPWAVPVHFPGHPSYSSIQGGHEQAYHLTSQGGKVCEKELDIIVVTLDHRI